MGVGATRISDISFHESLRIRYVEYTMDDRKFTEKNIKQ